MKTKFIPITVKEIRELWKVQYGIDTLPENAAIKIVETIGEYKDKKDILLMIEVLEEDLYPNDEEDEDND
jgi:hypothetical protein